MQCYGYPSDLPKLSTSSNHSSVYSVLTSTVPLGLGVQLLCTVEIWVDLSVYIFACICVLVNHIKLSTANICIIINICYILWSRSKHTFIFGFKILLLSTFIQLFYCLWLNSYSLLVSIGRGVDGSSAARVKCRSANGDRKTDHNPSSGNKNDASLHNILPICSSAMLVRITDGQLLVLNPKNWK